MTLLAFLCLSSVMRRTFLSGLLVPGAEACGAQSGSIQAFQRSSYVSKFSRNHQNYRVGQLTSKHMRNNKILLF